VVVERRRFFHPMGRTWVSIASIRSRCLLECPIMCSRGCRVGCKTGYTRGGIGLPRVGHPSPAISTGFSTFSWRGGEAVAQYPEPPEGPPPEISEELYGRLTKAEKRVLWRKFYAFQAECFGGPQGCLAAKMAAYRVTLEALRDEAINWAYTERSGDADDGSPRNAMQHAYWQCRMTQVFSESHAQEWGDAHELLDHPLTATEQLHANMDLFNNAVGRMAGRTGRSCADGVREAHSSGALRTAPFAFVPGPTFGAAPWGELPPPPPPADGGAY
jgi:hypothetical protein